MTTKENKADVYIQALSSVFKPVSSANEATHWFTTDEVYEAIKNINPGVGITKEQVHDTLINAGYTYQPRPGSFGLDFRWMLKAK